MQKFLLVIFSMVVFASNTYSQDTEDTLGANYLKYVYFVGDVNVASDNCMFTWDLYPNQRVGFTKKSGTFPRLTYSVNDGSYFAIAQSSSTNIRASNTFTDRLMIDGTGRVGIGTTTPNYQLDLQSPSNYSTVIGLQNTSSNGRYYALTSEGQSSGTGVGKFAIWDVTANTPRLVIAPNGNVGIGTTNPDKGALHIKGSFHVESDSFQVFHVSSKKALVFVGKTAYSQYQVDSAAGGTGAIGQNLYSLWVSGGIVSEDYAVAGVSSWSDYVFDRKYALPSLLTLEKYVRENKHLPAIPSEEEVKKKGYSLLKLNNGFLRTIEELTLYAIDQEKKIDALNEKVGNLQQKVQKYEDLAMEVEALKAAVSSLKK